MGRNPHEATAQAGGKQGYSGGTHGASGDNRSSGDGSHLRTKTTFNTPPKDTTSGGNGVKKFISNLPSVKLATAAYKGVKSIFQPKTEQQKVQANIDKGYDVNNPAEMHRATQRRIYTGPDGNGGGGANAHSTIATQSIVAAPTADKAAGFGHQWGFQAYPGTPGTTYNPQAYAKKGKMIRKYATGQEIKNFSKGKRFGPPPLKGPDPQGLQVILENSDYFKKLIG